MTLTIALASDTSRLGEYAGTNDITASRPAHFTIAWFPDVRDSFGNGGETGPTNFVTAHAAITIPTTRTRSAPRRKPKRRVTTSELQLGSVGRSGGGRSARSRVRRHLSVRGRFDVQVPRNPQRISSRGLGMWCLVSSGAHPRKYAANHWC